MKHPWEQIRLADYENHMKSDQVRQLQAMNAMMKSQLNQYSVASVMILGIAGGNGLEHIPLQTTTEVYGVDINQEYLKECRKRYPELGKRFRPVCADLTDSRLSLPQAELMVANLVIEYIGYRCFQKVITKVNPSVLSCGIQINSDNGFVSDSSYSQIFDVLNGVHHQIGQQELTQAMKEIGHRLLLLKEVKLSNGKKLMRLDFQHKDNKPFLTTEANVMDM